jgi:hypothetical protein
MTLRDFDRPAACLQVDSGDKQVRNSCLAGAFHNLVQFIRKLVQR